MRTNYLQMFIFVQSLVTKIKNPEWELTRMAIPFRASYKKARGLSRNATASQVLKDVTSWYMEQGDTVQIAKHLMYLKKFDIEV